MKLSFNKFKFAHQLFSKKLDSYIEIGEAIIRISVPYLTYCGQYKILGVQSNNPLGVIRYITEFEHQLFYIDIMKNGKKVVVFNEINSKAVAPEIIENSKYLFFNKERDGFILKRSSW